MNALAEYINALIYVGIAALIGVAMLTMSRLMSPKRPHEAKVAPYESGNPPAGYIKRFPAQFYVVGMLFIIFDVEVAFLWPYALNAGTLGLVGFVAVTVFTLVVLAGFAYEWAKGVMKWD